jgi:superfamily II RNA helicase
MMQGDFPVSIILRELEHDDLLPAILFRTARKQCDADIEALARNQHAILPLDRQERLTQEVKTIIQKYSFEPEFITAYPQYQALIATGVGAHHAGQLLIWRLLLEELMSRGMLRMMVATGTVAAGVDFRRAQPSLQPTASVAQKVLACSQLPSSSRWLAALGVVERTLSECVS